MQNKTQRITTQQRVCPLKPLSKISLSLHPSIYCTLPSSWPSQQRLNLNLSNTRSLYLSLLCVSNLGFSYLEIKLLLFGKLINRQQNLVMVLIVLLFVFSGFFGGFGFSCGATKVDAKRFRYRKASRKGKIRSRLFGQGEDCEFQCANFFSTNNNCANFC